MNYDVAHLVVVPKIYLKLPCEEWIPMGMADLEVHFINFPLINAYSALAVTQPFVVSFICAEDRKVIDLS